MLSAKLIGADLSLTLADLASAAEVLGAYMHYFGSLAANSWVKF
jgi:hypothetical protein